MLTTEDVEIIALDYLLKRDPPRITTPEALEFLEAFKKDVAFAESKGWSIELPFEIGGR